ncbi:organic solvent tolerance protein OstA, partial [Bacillus sp. mrc49]
MAKVQLNQKEQHYADTREEAEEIVSDAKKNN